MKYIKTFELNSKEYLDIWKDVLSEKYILYKANLRLYYILEIDYNKFNSIKILIDNSPYNIDYVDWIPTTRLYVYDQLLNKLMPIANREKRSEYNLPIYEKSNIIYQSNNLNSVKQLALTINDSEKYNL